MSSNVQYFILRAVVIVMFIISLIIVLFVANGYKYDFVSNQIRRTGIIDVSFEDKQAQVYLDGQKLEGSLPFVASNVLPGVYNLVVAREGYWDWEKEISVRENIISKVEGVLLYPLNEDAASKTLIENVTSEQRLEKDYYFQVKGKKLAFAKLNSLLTAESLVEVELPEEDLENIEVIAGKAMLQFNNGKRYLLDLISADLTTINRSENLVYGFDKWIYFKDGLLSVFDVNLDNVLYAKDFKDAEIAEVKYYDLNGLNFLVVIMKGQDFGTLYRYSNRSLLKIADEVVGQPFLDEDNNLILMRERGELWSLDMVKNKMYLIARFSDADVLSGVAFNENRDLAQLIWMNNQKQWNIGDKNLSNSQPMFDGKDIADLTAVREGEIYYLENIKSKEKPEDNSGSQLVLRQMILDI